MGYIHFFDDWKLISYHNLVRKQGRPEYVAEATLEDENTEGTWNFPMVARVPETGKYVGLYGAACTFPDDPNPTKVPEGVDSNLVARTQVLCYAQSDDGIHWERPDLRQKAKYDGPKFLKNQVFGINRKADGAPVYFDVYEKDAERRFKYLFNYKPEGAERDIRALATSGDGIVWNISHKFEQQEGTDTPTSVFYNPYSESYVFNVRRWKGDRRVFFLDTKDWEDFSEPRLIMHPDSQDEKLVGFYGMPVVEYEGLFVGLLWKIYCDPFTHVLPNGAVDCHLCYSYDGEHFNRCFREPFIPVNRLGEHGGGCVYTSSMVVDEDDNIRFYSGGSKAEHFQNQHLTDAALMMHRMRLDGFMYFATPSGRGTLRTRPMYINGDDLRINVKSPWGRVRVRILDEKGEVLEGYDFDDCAGFTGDELYWRPIWKGNKTFGGAKSEKRRQLEIEIVSGEIYGIRGDFEILKCLWYKDGQG